jgi:hypothetical protein
MSTNPLFIMVAASHHILMWFIPLFNVVAAPPHFNVGYSAIQCGAAPHHISMWCFPLFNVVLHHTTFPCGVFRYSMWCCTTPHFHVVSH